MWSPALGSITSPPTSTIMGAIPTKPPFFCTNFAVVLRRLGDIPPTFGGPGLFLLHFSRPSVYLQMGYRPPASYSSSARYKPPI